MDGFAFVLPHKIQKKKHCTRLLTTSSLSFESCFSSHTSNHEQGEFSTELSIYKYKKKLLT